MPEIRLAKTRAAYARCALCGGVGWVCEKHPDSPFNHGFCPWAGDPCPICQPGLVADSGMTANVIEGERH